MSEIDIQNCCHYNILKYIDSIPVPDYCSAGLLSTSCNLNKHCYFKQLCYANNKIAELESENEVLKEEIKQYEEECGV